MALWGWARLLPYVLGTGDATWTQYPHTKRLLDLVNTRPAAQRAEAFKAKYTFKTEMDADAKKFMFPQNERLKQG
jgi:GST-like protein